MGFFVSEVRSVIQSVLHMANSKSRTPSYMTTNRLGIYRFQYRAPRQFKACSAAPTLVRKSLATRDRNTALILARRWIVVLDDIALAYENRPNDYAKAVTALIKHSKHTPIRVNAIQNHSTGNAANNLNSKASVPTATTLSVALAKYLSEKRKTWNPKSVITNECNLGLKIETFIQIVGDIECISIGTAHIRDYKAALLKLPSNRSKRKEYKELSISELLNSSIPETHLLSPETLSGHLNKVSAFLDWGYRNGLMVADLKLPLLRVIKKPKHASSQRDAFNSNELKKLFNSTQYLNGTHKQPSHYFAPLLALFTGARQNEL